MRTRLAVSTATVVVLALAGCGGDAETFTIRGDFATPEGTPTSVRAEEADMEAQVVGGAFELAELSAGPATLRLLRGQEVLGRMEISDLPAGTELALHGLRVDPASGRAFPRTVEPRGVGVVLVNGVRMAAPGRVPTRVDAPGVVLGFAKDAGALLFRPDDGSIPDLRVVLGPTTESVTPDGDPVPLDGLATGDSVRVLGRGEEGFVIAERLTVPRHLALTREDGPVSSTEPDAERSSTGTSSDDASDGDGGSSASSSDRPTRTAVPVVSAPVARREVVREPRGRGNARGRANGGGRGGGKKAKKP